MMSLFCLIWCLNNDDAVNLGEEKIVRCLTSSKSTPLNLGLEKKSHEAGILQVPVAAFESCWSYSF